MLLEFLPCVYAFLACAGFCVLYNIHAAGIFFCSLGGALGWLVYLLTADATGGNDMVQSLLASLAISTYAEVMARVRKYPTTSYVIIGILPLVPGAGIYYTMEYAVAGETELFLSSFLHTLGLAGSMALGILLVGSVVRLITAGRRRRLERKE